MDINTLHQKAKDGDFEAEKSLLRLLTVRFRYLATLRLGNEFDAEEVSQDALIVISGEMKKIVVESSFAAWAFKVLDYRIRNYARSKERKVGAVDWNMADAAHSNPGDRLKRRLLDCLRKINIANPRYARILNLNYQGFTTEEICEKMEITSGNLYVMLSRARSALRECLEKGGYV